MIWLAALCVLADLWWRSELRPRRRPRVGGVADLVDLLLLGARSGRDRRDCLALAAEFARPELAEGLATCVARIDRGHSVDGALSGLAGLDPAVDVVVAVLGATEESGAAVGDDLERLRVDVVQLDTGHAAAAARRMAVWQTGPLVLCHLPAVVVIAIAPHLGL